MPFKPGDKPHNKLDEVHTERIVVLLPRETKMNILRALERGESFSSWTRGAIEDKLIK